MVLLIISTLLYYIYFFKKSTIFINTLKYKYMFNIFLLIFFISIYNYFFIYYFILFQVYLNLPVFNIFNLSILFIALYFGLLIIFLADLKINKKKVNAYNLLIFLMVVSVLYVYTDNYIYFFYLYELFLLPSIYLVYYLSPNKRSLIATFYFLIWTQLGSFFVFLAVILLLLFTNKWYFSLIHGSYISLFNKNILLGILFIGFGLKIPVWPFHYWLTKTHVEAPTFFSIYLSGFLVKTALYGFYKFYVDLNFNNSLIIYYTILLVSVFDASLKFWGQIDLKKLVAYSTIQEMNLIFIGILWGTYKSYIYAILFCITHAFLSTLFFFIIDIIYKRYNSRSIYNVNSIFLNYPILSFNIILACVNYNGFPFSIKFFVEIYFFILMLDLNILVFLITIYILNWIGSISFTYLWFRTLFGLNMNIYKTVNIDLTKKELLIFIITFFFFYQLIFILYYIF